MHIFISYSKKDIEFARHVRALLRADKFAVWMDEEGISGGDEWETTIEKNLTSCAAFVIILSPDAKDSDWVRNELLLAQKLKKPIFPILYRGDVWWNLAHIQYEEMQKGLQAKLTPKFVARLRGIMPNAPAPQTVTLSIQHGDITKIEADVVALKHAQNFYGADLVIASRLNASGVAQQAMEAAPGEYALIPTKGSIAAPYAVFLGVPKARHFGYADIQMMAARALRVLKTEKLDAAHLAMTIHGSGFGLDEIAALAAQINGYLDAFHAGDAPPTLRQITVVEFIDDRVKRLRAAFEQQFGAVFERAPGESWAYEYIVGLSTDAPATPTARASEEQPYTFVIMSNDPALDDYFYYGVQNAVHGMGDLCVRMDLTLGDAESISQIKQKLDGAHLVIADLTAAPTAALLYLGYAWGKGAPTILIKQRDAAAALAGDVLLYDRIRDLEDGLRQTISDLRAAGRLT